MPRRLLCMLAFIAAAVISGGVLGEGIESRNVSVVQGDEALVVRADFEFELTQRLEEALNNGVALYFVVEFELLRPRWYWFDEKAAAEKLTRRLVYHPLSRQYRVSRGALYQNFATLAEALRTVGTVRNWAVVERERLKPEGGYVALLRMRLDTTQLPKPLQVSAFASREWALASDWTRVAFTADNAGGAAR